MSPRYYDLSEQVVPGQGAEAITDTPGKEEPTDTTEGVRNKPKETDPTKLDSNPANEDETRNPDEREDVTNLASRRARAKRSTPVPKLSTNEFSNILKHIDRLATANPAADFGKVVVSGVRQYSYRANKNALSILSAVVPTLLRSGNFDQADRKSLTTLYNQIVAQRKLAEDPSAPGGGDSMSGGAPPADPMGGGATSDALQKMGPDPSAGAAANSPAPPDPAMGAATDAAGALGDAMGGQGPGGMGITDMIAPGAEEMIGGTIDGLMGNDPMTGASPDAAAGGGLAEAPGAGGHGAPPKDVGMGNAPAGIPGGGTAAPAEVGMATDPNAALAKPLAKRRGSIRRGRSVMAATNPPPHNDEPADSSPQPDASAAPSGPPGTGGPLHFDTGGAPNPVQVQHQQDNGDGTSGIINEMGQPENVNNTDLYHDHTMSAPVTQPKPDDAPPAPDAAPAPPKPDAPAPPEKKAAMRRKAFSKRAEDDDSDWTDQFEDSSEDSDDEKKESRRKGRRRTAEDNLDVAKKDTDSKNVEAPNTDTSDRAQQTQYDRGEYDQNGPLLTDPDESTDQNWPPKSSAVDAIRLADVYVDLGLIEPEQKYQVVAGFEKMNSYIVKDRLKVLSAVSEKIKKSAPQKNRSMVPQSSKLPSMGRGSSLNGHGNDDISAHFLAL